MFDCSYRTMASKADGHDSNTTMAVSGFVVSRGNVRWSMFHLPTAIFGPGLV